MNALTATSGEDFEPVATTIGFAPGQVSRTVSVEALADAAVEPAEAFTVTISQPTGDAVIGANSTATVTILGQEVAPGPTPSPDPTADPSPDPTPDPVTDSRDRQPPVIGRVTVKRVKRGTKIRFALSEPAAVTVQVQRKRGRRFVPAGTLTRDGVGGANRIRGRALKRGRYRVIVAAVDAAGNSSTAAPRRFRVARSTPSPKDPS